MNLEVMNAEGMRRTIARCMQRRVSRLALAVTFLALLHMAAILAGFLAPYDYAAQDRTHPFARPVHVHWIDCQGRMHLRPFVYATVVREGSFDSYSEDCSQQAAVKFFVRGDEYTILGWLHGALHLFGVAEPARISLMGTDGYGRDQFSRLLFGGQVSLFAGLAAALLSLIVGLAVGGIAGAFGGWVDDVAMRVTEITMAVPSFYLLLTVRAFLPLQMEPAAAFGLVVVAIGFWNWSRPARMVRGIVLSGRERNFVLAARGFGAGKLYLLRRHLAPMTFSVLLTQMAILIPQFILAEVILSFLGLGIGEPFPSWGNMLAYAQQYHILVNYWWMLLPGVALVPVILAYHALSDAVQEKLQSTN
jgi:peptide/nickel transport system permease protein